MGQSSIPVLNRSGYSMFWTSVWDSKHNYTSLFKEDVLIRKYISLLFNEKISAQPTMFNKNINFSNVNYWQKIYNIKFVINKSSLATFLQRFNKLPVYISKIHIIRLNGWVILYFVGSTPSTFKKSDIVTKLKQHKHSFFFKKNAIYQFKKSLFF